MTFVAMWERFLDSLDSSGGHIAALFVLMGVSAALVKCGIQSGEQLLMGAFGALLLALKQANSNHHRHADDKPQP